MVDVKRVVPEKWSRCGVSAQNASEFFYELIPPTPLTIRGEWTAFWERSGGAGNTFLKLFSIPEIRARIR
jgi:hypothetical protein